MQEIVSIMCSSGFVQQGGDSANLVTAYAALRPRDGFSHPHQKHMKGTYSLVSTINEQLSCSRWGSNVS